MEDMNEQQADATVRLQRPPPKVYTDERGRTIWMGGVESCRFELETDIALSTNPYDSAVAN